MPSNNDSIKLPGVNQIQGQVLVASTIIRDQFSLTKIITWMKSQILSPCFYTSRKFCYNMKFIFPYLTSQKSAHLFGKDIIAGLVELH